MSAVLPQIQAAQPVALPRPPLGRPKADKPLCPGCGGLSYAGGRQQCPAYSLTCHFRAI